MTIDRILKFNPTFECSFVEQNTNTTKTSIGYYYINRKRAAKAYTNRHANSWLYNST